MWHRAYLLTVLLALSLSSAVWAQRAPTRVEFLDRIVAIINNDIITAYELSERIRVVQRQLEDQKIPVPAQDVLEKQLLERMINEKVQLQFEIGRAHV